MEPDIPISPGSQSPPTRSTTVNLLRHDNDDALAIEPAPDATVAAPIAAAPIPPIPKSTPGRKKAYSAAVAIAALLILAGGGYYLYTGVRPEPAPDQASLPAPTPAEPEKPATPPAAPAPAPETVTAPTVAPSADNPQTVTVKAERGLWLRSSPDSSNQSNVIGWIPNGGQVSVDSTGDFWWHGTYKGKTGYFASKYTQ